MIKLNVDFDSVDLGKAPDDDNRQHYYQFYYDYIQPIQPLRKFLRWYFYPKNFEQWNKSTIYRYLGVPFFGRVIPTGGLFFRLFTGKKMKAYVLQKQNITSVRKYFFQTCVFEALHLIVFLILSVVVIMCFCLGKNSLAISGTVGNLLVNVYPIMLQRYNRIRILNLLVKWQAGQYYKEKNKDQ